MTKKQSKVMRSFQIRMITQLAQGSFSSIDLKNEIFVKWLVGYMAAHQIPFQLVPMGAGVTRIVLSGCLCSHCQGKGFVPDSEENGLQRPHLLEALEEENEDQVISCCGDSCNCENGCGSGGTCCSERRNAA
ncbi:hypothetical protein OOT00_03970 [Desulfobotulus sp. H1]|uniref:Uncharacterized protein n=1 Tax=Desulfobotulus pelophilus TaxID=2823377 RepID=A0ABT3N6R0_9BACT|nr:hypothetical protein [Desulfobotulus pelophilus]MCW7753139.1 hypothetical protein [Desulfobotulus pelophilus]